MVSAETKLVVERAKREQQRDYDQVGVENESRLIAHQAFP